jgi:hypothetical protein
LPSPLSAAAIELIAAIGAILAAAKNSRLFIFDFSILVSMYGFVLISTCSVQYSKPPVPSMPRIGSFAVFSSALPPFPYPYPTHLVSDLGLSA